MAKTLKNVIDFCDGIKPNAFTAEQKTQWINEVEGMAQTEVMLIALDDVVQYAYSSDQNDELLVSPPHDKIYISYLCAMIDFANGEYNKYNNTMELFNAQFSEYMAWYARTLSPADENCGFLGYYLSAYAIAVKHGYDGSETEWLASLKGETGETGAKGDTGATGAAGARGETGEGVPAGGTTGQVLKKTSGDDYAAEWGDGGMTPEERAQRPAIDIVEELPNDPDPDTVYLVTDGGNRVVILQAVTVSAFSSYTASGSEEGAIYGDGFIYRAAVTSGVPAGSYLPSVTYSYSDAISGDYCAGCIYDSAGTLYLYSKSTAGITVPIIRLEAIE